MDYRNWYRRISAPFRGKTARTALNTLDKFLVYSVAIAYIATLVYLAATSSPHLCKALCVPAFTFALVTIVRAILDKPRPYESFDIDPIIFKDTHGKSMPSRHMASVTVIAYTFTWLFWPAGALSFIACALVAFTRIVGGVHFPHDIAAAAAIATTCSIIGLFAIP